MAIETVEEVGGKKRRLPSPSPSPRQLETTPAKRPRSDTDTSDLSAGIVKNRKSGALFGDDDDGVLAEREEPLQLTNRVKIEWFGHDSTPEDVDCE